MVTRSGVKLRSTLEQEMESGIEILRSRARDIYRETSLGSSAMFPKRHSSSGMNLREDSSKEAEE